LQFIRSKIFRKVRENWKSNWSDWGGKEEEKKGGKKMERGARIIMIR